MLERLIWACLLCDAVTHIGIVENRTVIIFFLRTRRTWSAFIFVVAAWQNRDSDFETFNACADDNNIWNEWFYCRCDNAHNIRIQYTNSSAAIAVIILYTYAISVSAGRVHGWKTRFERIRQYNSEVQNRIIKIL